LAFHAFQSSLVGSEKMVALHIGSRRGRAGTYFAIGTMLKSIVLFPRSSGLATAALAARLFFRPP
jgi:hypothetical protein